MKRMDIDQAADFVREHWDDDRITDDEVEACFSALFERDADDQDKQEGLWSHCCNAVCDIDVMVFLSTDVNGNTWRVNVVLPVDSAS